ncbi:hypothetical protein B0O99DRAFT_250655 [Bisporella sp. PMI_857]|nr:hypothetical protein B0O99DRAFT_250655 [Bisporella sp. PMI_857]
MNWCLLIISSTSPAPYSASLMCPTKSIYISFSRCCPASMFTHSNDTYHCSIIKIRVTSLRDAHYVIFFSFSVSLFAEDIYLPR